MILALLAVTDVLIVSLMAWRTQESVYLALALFVDLLIVVLVFERLTRRENET